VDSKFRQVVSVADILPAWNARRKNTRLDFLYGAGFDRPDSPLGQELMNCVLAEVVPVADTPHGPPANEIELHNAHLKIGDSPLRERPDLGRKTYKVLRYRSSQGCVSQECQCRERRRIIHRDPPVCELPRLKAKDLLSLDTVRKGSPWIGGPAWEKRLNYTADALLRQPTWQHTNLS
jgi:hypothetical protein